MSTLSLSAKSQSSGDQSYLSNVGQAARSLVAALLSVQRNQPASLVVDANQIVLQDLESLSGPYDAVMPALGQELRFIAARS